MTIRPYRNEEEVQCGDETYTLAIDIAVIDALEDEFDLPFTELMGLFEGTVRVGRMARLLRGMLRRHHPDLTLDDVGGLVIAYGSQLGEGMQRLFEKASPSNAEATAEANPPKAQHGTGAKSSSHGAPQGSRRASSGSKRRELSPSS
jgi:hypothetical protein